MSRAARRVLIFGYYDGALDGVMESDTGEVFRFQSLDIEEQLPELAGRTYALRTLPPTALDRLVAIIAPHFAPKWPAWMPLWIFADEPTRQDVETRTDSILNEAGPVIWKISTKDYWDFSRFTAARATLPTTVLN